MSLPYIIFSLSYFLPLQIPRFNLILPFPFPSSLTSLPFFILNTSCFLVFCISPSSHFLNFFPSSPSHFPFHNFQHSFFFYLMYVLNLFTYSTTYFWIFCKSPYPLYHLWVYLSFLTCFSSWVSPGGRCPRTSIRQSRGRSMSQV